MEEQNIENKRKKTIDIEKLKNTIVWLTVLIFVVTLVPYLLLWPSRGFSSLNTSVPTVVILSVLVILGFVVHELIHGVTWACFAEHGWRSISFGVFWKQLMPYCHCDDPLRLRHYVIGALMPCFIIGILPVIVAYIIGDCICFR